MKVIFGIGNPGEEYQFTRHNVGFRVIDALSKELSIPVNRMARNYVYGESSDVLLVKPMTFVNLSGLAAREVVEETGIDLENFLVVLDDASLPLGRARLRTKGSSGGHKGLKSVIYELGTIEFPRLRIGIGPVIGSLSEFVLQNFTEEEEEILQDVIKLAVNTVKLYIEEGIDEAAKYCNRRTRPIVDE